MHLSRNFHFQSFQPSRRAAAGRFPGWNSDTEITMQGQSYGLRTFKSMHMATRLPSGRAACILPMLAALVNQQLARRHRRGEPAVCPTCCVPATEIWYDKRSFQKPSGSSLWAGNAALLRAAPQLTQLSPARLGRPPTRRSPAGAYQPNNHRQSSPFPEPLRNQGACSWAFQGDKSPSSDATAARSGINRVKSDGA